MVMANEETHEREEMESDNNEIEHETLNQVSKEA